MSSPLNYVKKPIQERLCAQEAWWRHWRVSGGDCRGVLWVFRDVKAWAQWSTRSDMWPVLCPVVSYSIILSSPCPAGRVLEDWAMARTASGVPFYVKWVVSLFHRNIKSFPKLLQLAGVNRVVSLRVSGLQGQQRKERLARQIVQCHCLCYIRIWHYNKTTFSFFSSAKFIKSKMLALPTKWLLSCYGKTKIA